MRVKDLMPFLNLADPEAEIHFQFGESDDYRIAVARMISEQPLDVDYKEDITPMLENLDFAAYKYDIDRNEVQVTFSQGYVTEKTIHDEITKIIKLRNELKNKKV